MSMTGPGLRMAGALAATVFMMLPSLAQDLPVVEAPPLDPIEGIWQTRLLSEVTITSCAEGFCGYLSRIVVPTENLTAEEAEAAAAMAPETFTDARNKDPELRNRPMLGLQLLTLRPSQKPNIYDGEIYNPRTAIPIRATSKCWRRTWCGSMAACCSTRSAGARTGPGCRRPRRRWRRSSSTGSARERSR